MEQAGPKGKIPEDVRLGALLAHRKALESAPAEGKDSLIKALLPLALASGMDLASTEVALASNPDLGEGNPMPGMGGTSGRVSSAALQLALLGLARKYDKRYGDKLIKGKTAVHGALAMQNFKLGQEPNSGDRR